MVLSWICGRMGAGPLGKGHTLQRRACVPLVRQLRLGNERRATRQANALASAKAISMVDSGSGVPTGIRNPPLPYPRGTLAPWRRRQDVNAVVTSASASWRTVARSSGPWPASRPRPLVPCSSATRIALRATQMPGHRPRDALGTVRGVVAGIDEMDVLPPTPIEGQAMRTEFGRPRSSMRLRMWTATSTSVARRSSACERSASPITRLNRDMAVSARARRV